MNDPTSPPPFPPASEKPQPIEARLLEEPAAAETAKPAARRKLVPLLLFLLTCASTFWAGSTQFVPEIPLWLAGQAGDWMPVREAIVAHWPAGLIYMGCLLAILLTHEMGHFLATVRYGIPASLPYFIPFPISPIGTWGAVIGMAGLKANRREIFDIGIAGPLAGLAVALPVMWFGTQQLDLTTSGHGPLRLDLPLLVRFLLPFADVPGYEDQTSIWLSQVNPYFMAGWVGLLITGLNMLPMSQLDGGHVVHALFGARSRFVARGCLLAALVYIVFSGAMLWVLMAVLIILMGVDHPPTSDDTVRLGWPRTLLGWFSLAIPLLCFPPRGLLTVG